MKNADLRFKSEESETNHHTSQRPKAPKARPKDQKFSSPPNHLPSSFVIGMKTYSSNQPTQL